MGIYKPLNYDATMLIRLTTEMKDAFFLLVVRLVAVVPSEEARRLIVAQVLEQWGVDPKKPAFGALRRYAGDVSSCSS